MALSCAQTLLGKKDLHWEQWADLYMMFPFVKHGSANETHEDHIPTWRSFVQENVFGSQWDWTQFLDSGNKQLIIPVAAVLEMQHAGVHVVIGGEPTWDCPHVAVSVLKMSPTLWSLVVATPYALVP